MSQDPKLLFAGQFDLVQNFVFEADVRFHLSSSLTLEDPSDGDMISLDSSQHITLTGNLYYRFSLDKIVPYVLIGAGIDALTGTKDQTLTSELGYEITVFSPAKKSSPVLNIAVGCLFPLNQKLDLRADIRYVRIFGSEDLASINSINAVIGAVFNF